MASQAFLSAASNDRKAKLARLKSLKQKQAPTSQDADEHRDVDMSGREERAAITPDPDAPTDQTTTTSRKRSHSASPSTAQPAYLSGRNYDAATRGPKLGFENAPESKAQTVEARAAALAEETRRAREEEEKADKPLDLFKLQPKKPNWDLKRDLEKKLKVLDVRTENAIARLVRERVLREKEVERSRANGKDGDADGGEAVGMEGATLVEAMHQREREEEAEEKRERMRDEEDAT